MLSLSKLNSANLHLGNLILIYTRFVLSKSVSLMRKQKLYTIEIFFYLSILKFKFLIHLSVYDFY